MRPSSALETALFPANLCSAQAGVGADRETEGTGMNQRMRGLLIAGTMMVSAAALGACATKDYVNKQVATVDTHVTDVSARVTEHDSKIATLDRTSQDALNRATAAGKLAEGKFLYSEV